MKAYKNNIKHVVLTIQVSRVAAEWEPSNFPLYNINGLRKSCIEHGAVIDYVDL